MCINCPAPLSDALYGGDDGTLLVDTFNLILNDTVDFLVVVAVDTRMLVMRQAMLISEGEPPEITIT